MLPSLQLKCFGLERGIICRETDQGYEEFSLIL